MGGVVWQGSEDRFFADATFDDANRTNIVGDFANLLNWERFCLLAGKRATRVKQTAPRRIYRRGNFAGEGNSGSLGPACRICYGD